MAPNAAALALDCRNIDSVEAQDLRLPRPQMRSSSGVDMCHALTVENISLVSGNALQLISVRSSCEQPYAIQRIGKAVRVT